MMYTGLQQPLRPCAASYGMLTQKQKETETQKNKKKNNDTIPD